MLLVASGNLYDEGSSASAQNVEVSRAVDCGGYSEQRAVANDAMMMSYRTIVASCCTSVRHSD